jgi:N-methylhydantoinase B/oxoprolinase/acetone carboxylase alpha subunit
MVEKKVSKLTIDIIMHNLEAITRIMADVLMKTSYSPILYDMNDFSTALLTADAELLALSIGCPVHLAAMPAAVEAVRKEFEGEIEPDDVFLMNDPYLGGTHIGDYTFISPLFIDGELVGFAGTRVHVVDPGSTTAGAYAEATEIIQEGLRIPPVKLYSRGKPVKDVLKLILSHTRLPESLHGDIRAAVASNETGKRFLASLYKKYGKDVMDVCVKEILNYAERNARKGISEIPRGTYSAEDYIDSDHITPDPVKIKVTIRVTGDEMEVDWTGTSPPVPGPLNRPKHAAIGDTMYALKPIIDPKGPFNSGYYRAIKVIIPEKCLLNAKWPSPVDSGNLETTARMTDVIWQALAEAVPEKVEGMTYGYCGGIQPFGFDPRTGKPYSFWEGPPGGWGGRATKDGWNATWHLLGNCRDTPIEVMEVLYPIRVVRSELRRDSGGPGKFRGGLGLIREYEFVDHSPLSVYIGGDRSKAGPPGVLGGKRGAPFRATLITKDGKEEVVAGMREDGTWVMNIRTLWRIPPNSRIRLEEAGGGGYGNPLERDPELVLKDVINGYISLEAAKNEYGVVIDPEKLTIDIQATNELRRKLLARKY